MRNICESFRLSVRSAEVGMAVEDGGVNKRRGKVVVLVNELSSDRQRKVEPR